jgi:hypothetical protein
MNGKAPTPVQIGVQLVTNMTQLGMTGPEYEKAVSELHTVMGLLGRDLALLPPRLSGLRRWL